MSFEVVDERRVICLYRLSDESCFVRLSISSTGSDRLTCQSLSRDRPRHPGPQEPLNWTTSCQDRALLQEVDDNGV